MKRIKNNMIPILPVCLFFFLTVSFFSPMDVYMANYTEFVFAFNPTWWIVLLFAVALALIATVFICLLPKKICRVLCFLLFSGTVAFYFQSMFLNGAMSSFTGEEVSFNRQDVAVDIVAWAAIVLMIWIVLFLSDRKQSEKVSEILSVMAAGMIVIQLAGFLSAIPGLPDNDASKQGYLSSEGEYSLAPQKNTVFFILDACDQKYVQKALSEYPDLFDDFKGFVYYPDAVSHYGRTFPSVAYLLTHQDCYFDSPFPEFIHDAWQESRFLPALKENGADVRLFTDSSYYDAGSGKLAENFSVMDYGDVRNLHPFVLFKQMTRVSLYKGLPYLFKPLFEYSAQDVNKYSVAGTEDSAIQFDDYEFYQHLLANGLTVDEQYSSAFRFYHMIGVHPGARTNADVEIDPDADTSEMLKGCLKIINTYVSYMKELGIFDDSEIIITADHEMTQISGPDYGMTGPGGIIMLVKQPGVSDNVPLKISDAQVCHDDLFAAIYESQSIDGNGYGETIWNIPEGKQRTRYHYYTVLFDDTDGEIAIREYAITGDSRDFDNYHLTGNNWDIDYSQRDVSKQRLPRNLVTNYH